MRWMTIEHVLELFGRYPWLWALAIAFVWNAGTTLATAVLHRFLPVTAEEWADLFKRRPRVAALAELLKSGGVDVVGTARALYRFLGGSPPSWLLHGRPPPTVEELHDLGRRLAVEERERLIATLKAANDQERTRVGLPPAPPLAEPPQPPGAA